jgi:hypothetical protein
MMMDKDAAKTETLTEMRVHANNSSGGQRSLNRSMRAPDPALL